MFTALSSLYTRGDAAKAKITAWLHELCLHVLYVLMFAICYSVASRLEASRWPLTDAMLAAYVRRR